MSGAGIRAPGRRARLDSTPLDSTPLLDDQGQPGKTRAQGGDRAGIEELRAQGGEPFSLTPWRQAQSPYI